MIDAAFQGSTDAVLQDMADRPRAPRVQAPRFSVWGTVDATARGFAAGINQVVGSAADVLGAFGEMTAAGYPDMVGFVPDRQERQRQVDAALKMQREGPDFMSPIGASFRNVAQNYMPDPTTAHAAEVVVADFVRVATKAVGAAVTLGPLAGAAVAGAEEGFTQSDALARQGVDLATRSKVGAVTGAVTAAGLALPVAGRTWAQTVGLAVAGGPASFVAQNAANRAILEAADYGKQAEQFDPFDPVGLTLSTLLPLGFGAMAMRGARSRAVPQEVEDAARAGLLRENVEANRLTPEQDIRAAGEHQAAVDRALQQMAAGQRVDVADVAPAPRVPTVETPEFRTWFGDSQVVDEQGAPRVVYHGTAADFDQFDPRMTGSAIDAGKLGEGFYFSESNKWAGAYAENAAKRGGAANVQPVYLRMDNPLELAGKGDVWSKLRAISKEWGIADDPVTDASATPNPTWARRFTQEAMMRGHDGVVLPSVSGQTEYVAFSANQIKSAIGNSGRFDPNSGSLTDSPYQSWSEGVNAAVRQMRAEMEATQPAPRTQAPAAEQSPARAPATTEQSPARAADDPGARADAALATPYDRAIAELEAQNPDMPVQLDGMDKPVPLRELLAQVREEAQADLADVPLLEAAATCFIRTGAAAA